MRPVGRAIGGLKRPLYRWSSTCQLGHARHAAVSRPDVRRANHDWHKMHQLTARNAVIYLCGKPAECSRLNQSRVVARVGHGPWVTSGQTPGID